MGEIVVAIDGSEHSYPVVDEAVKLAKQWGSRLVLVHVVPRLSVPEEFVKFVQTERIEEPPEFVYQRMIGEQILKRFGERIEDAGVKHELVLRIGNPAEEILEVVKERRPSILVIGLIGLHGLRRVAALGSVARRVLEEITCPVLVVPHMPS